MATDYKQLYYENKGSLFILNIRDSKKLLKSFKNCRLNQSLYDRLHKYNPELMSEKTESGFITFAENHNKEVIAFFEKQPNAKFIVYDIENVDISKLKKYIELNGISEFPKLNVS